MKNKNIFSNLSNKVLELLQENSTDADTVERIEVELYNRWLCSLSFEDLMLESADLQEVYLGDAEKGVEPSKVDWIREKAERDFWLCEEEMQRRGGLAIELKKSLFKQCIQNEDVPTLLEGLASIIKEDDLSTAWKVEVYQNQLQDLGVEYDKYEC